MEIVRLENVEKVYNPGAKNSVQALKNINFAVEKGDLISIQGVSGSGKSSLLHIIGCLDKPTNGNYYFEGREITFSNRNKISDIRNKKIGFVLQQFGLLNDRDVTENVALPLMFTNCSLKNAGRIAKEVLAKLSIGHLADKKINQLSGGEKQRVAIARALVNQPELILADEPTGSLDSKTGMDIVELLASLSEEGKTVIIVTHDDRVAEHCKKKYWIKDGCICEVTAIPISNQN